MTRKKNKLCKSIFFVALHATKEVEDVCAQVQLKYSKAVGTLFEIRYKRDDFADEKVNNNCHILFISMLLFSVLSFALRPQRT